MGVFAELADDHMQNVCDVDRRRRQKEATLGPCKLHQLLGQSGKTPQGGFHVARMFESRVIESLDDHTTRPVSSTEHPPRFTVLAAISTHTSPISMRGLGLGLPL